MSKIRNCHPRPMYCRGVQNVPGDFQEVLDTLTQWGISFTVEGETLHICPTEGESWMEVHLFDWVVLTDKGVCLAIHPGVFDEMFHLREESAPVKELPDPSDEGSW